MPLFRRFGHSGDCRLGPLFQGRYRPVGRTIVKSLRSQGLPQPYILLALNFLTVVGSARIGASHGEDAPSGVGRKSKVHHRGPRGAEHIQIHWFFKERPGSLYDLLGEGDVLAGYPEFFRAGDHPFRRWILQHQLGNSERLTLEVVFDGHFRCLGQGFPLLFHYGQVGVQHLAKIGIGGISMAKRQDGGSCSLG